MTRLSEQQLQAVKDKASSAHNKLVRKAKKKVAEEQGQGAFFAVLFQLAAQCIEDDVEGFCDLAETIFDEIEAHGKEPQLSEDWLKEVTGEKDTFNFSTENLVSDLVSPPRSKRRKKKLSQDEKERLRQQVEAAIIDDDSPRDLHQALAVAHGENVEHWIKTIQKVLENEGGTAEFWMLREKTGLKPAELFLGVLLGQEHWFIAQDKFYGTITVGTRRKKSKLR